MQSRAAVVGALSVLLLSSFAGAQDVDVPGNLTMQNSASTVGNILKDNLPFIHNFGFRNTFLGSNAGNFTMSGFRNAAIGVNALSNNTNGNFNIAIGDATLFSNTGGAGNTAVGHSTLIGNTIGNGNTGVGANALIWNSTGSNNAANGVRALFYNTTGDDNTASGNDALLNNTTGGNNTAVGSNADVSAGDLTNATAIGAGAVVDDSNKIRLGNHDVTIIEGEVGFTASSDRNKKENLRPVGGEGVLGKIRGMSLSSWNFIGQDAKQFRHYGPMAQDFFAAFGHDGIGTIGTPTTITTTDIDGVLMVAAQALEKRSVKQREEIEVLKAENAELKKRLEALERRVGGYALSKAE